MEPLKRDIFSAILLLIIFIVTVSVTIYVAFKLPRYLVEDKWIYIPQDKNLTTQELKLMCKCNSEEPEDNTPKPIENGKLNPRSNLQLTSISTLKTTPPKLSTAEYKAEESNNDEMFDYITDKRSNTNVENFKFSSTVAVINLCSDCLRGFKYICCGVLVTFEWVLAAGEKCGQNVFPKETKIRAGSDYWWKGGQLSEVASMEIFYHADFYLINVLNSFANLSIVHPITTIWTSYLNEWFKICWSLDIGLRRDVMKLDSDFWKISNDSKNAINKSCVIMDQFDSFFGFENFNKKYFLCMDDITEWIIKTTNSTILTEKRAGNTSVCKSVFQISI